MNTFTVTNELNEYGLVLQNQFLHNQNEETDFFSQCTRTAQNIVCLPFVVIAEVSFLVADIAAHCIPCLKLTADNSTLNEKVWRRLYALASYPTSIISQVYANTLLLHSYPNTFDRRYYQEKPLSKNLIKQIEETISQPFDCISDWPKHDDISRDFDREYHLFTQGEDSVLSIANSLRNLEPDAIQRNEKMLSIIGFKPKELVSLSEKKYLSHFPTIMKCAELRKYLLTCKFEENEALQMARRAMAYSTQSVWHSLLFELDTIGVNLAFYRMTLFVTQEGMPRLKLEGMNNLPETGKWMIRAQPMTGKKIAHVECIIPLSENDLLKNRTITVVEKTTTVPLYTKKLTAGVYCGEEKEIIPAEDTSPTLSPIDL